MRLTVHDVDLDGGVLWIRGGKGGRDRVVPLGGRASKWIGDYLIEVRPRLVGAERVSTLFLTDYGEPFGKNRLGEGATHPACGPS